MLRLAIGLVLAVLWVRAVTNYDVSPTCKPEDCENCPFPRCNEKDRKRHIGK